MVYSSYISLSKKVEGEQPEEAENMLKIFKNLYKKVKYRALTYHIKPFIFAYSSLVTDEII